MPSMVQRQQTLKAPIHCTGAGLHSNARVSMTLWPAPPDSGIAFRRSDVDAHGDIRAVHSNVVDTQLSTSLGYNGSGSINTVEHLMAALAGLGVDNAVVEIDGQEVPVMDGSAAPFVFLIECAGVVEQDAPRRAIKVLKEIRVGDENRWAALKPASSFSLHCAISFDHRLVGQQSVCFDPSLGSFKNELAVREPSASRKT